MRKIKFRAWHDFKKYWIHDDTYGCDILGEMILFGGWMADIGIEELNDVVVEQFTGLIDKNGKEIYEGDICKISFFVNQVEDYIYNSLTERELETGERIFVVDSPLFNNQPELNVDDIEIIGNIHDNPELING